MKNYVTEHRFDFQGGYCTAYLMSDAAGALYVHTITRLSGSFAKTAPFAVREGADTDALLARVASSIPLLGTGEPSHY